MNFEERDRMRCKCVGSELEEVESLPNCLRCKTCGGWYTLSISSLSDMALVRNEFAGGPKETDEPA